MPFVCVCVQPLANASTKFKGARFHQKCWNAVRCFKRLRMEVGGAGRVQKSDDELLSSPSRWREAVNSAIAPPRARSMRASSAGKEYKANEVIEDSFVLTRRQVMKFKQDWDDLSGSEAEDEFFQVLRKRDVVGLRRGQGRAECAEEDSQHSRHRHSLEDDLGRPTLRDDASVEFSGEQLASSFGEWARRHGPPQRQPKRNPRGDATTVDGEQTETWSDEDNDDDNNAPRRREPLQSALPLDDSDGDASDCGNKASAKDMGKSASKRRSNTRTPNEKRQDKARTRGRTLAPTPRR